MRVWAILLLSFSSSVIQEGLSNSRQKRTECDDAEFLTPILRIERNLEEIKSEINDVLSKVGTVEKTVQRNEDMLRRIRQRQRWYEVCHSKQSVCRNGGSCHVSHDDKYLYEDEDIDIESYICICTAGWSGRHCEVADSLGQYIEHGYYSNQYKQKTLYPWAYPKQPPQKNDLMTVTFDNRACTAVHANFVLRHAARYTTVGVMRDFTKLHEKIKCSYGSQNYSFIDSWNNTYPEGKAESVTRAGEYEMEYLGIMYGNRLYDLLKSAFSVSGGFADKLMFAGTRSTRTQTSAKLFSGWLSEVISGINQKSSKVLIRDDVLRFWDNCRAYKDATSDKQEMSRFEHGTHFQGVIQNVINKLELNGTLTVDDVKTLYVLCATELAINNNPDWCTLLSDDDLQVLQYDADIEDNIRRLYGHPIIGQMSCPLASDIFTTLDSVIHEYGHNQNYTIGTFQFGHSDTVLDFSAALGLYKDAQPLTAGNYELLQNRKFNTAKVNPFSSHLAFILYNCGGTSSDDFVVRLLVNGEPMDIPACNSDICHYQDVRQAYSHLVEGCDWNNLCSSGVLPPNIAG